MLLRCLMEIRGYANEGALVDADWLEEHLDDPHVRVVEVDVSPKKHTEGHIPGAVLWNIYSDLRDPAYQLRDRAAFEQLVASSGIQPETRVVFYGYAPAIGFWLMNLYGHTQAHILNLSRDAWQSEGRPWETDAASFSASDYSLGEEDDAIHATRAFVVSAIADETKRIFDVRSANEFQGERFWPSGGIPEGARAGHVPSAEHVPADDLLTDRGAFRDAKELRKMYADLNIAEHEDVITYCTIGARASTVWFVLKHLIGYERVRVYHGSWAEWGFATNTPVESDAPVSSE